MLRLPNRTRVFQWIGILHLERVKGKLCCIGRTLPTLLRIQSNIPVYIVPYVTSNVVFCIWECDVCCSTFKAQNSSSNIHIYWKWWSRVWEPLWDLHCPLTVNDSREKCILYGSGMCVCSRTRVDFICASSFDSECISCCSAPLFSHLLQSIPVLNNPWMTTWSTNISMTTSCNTWWAFNNSSTVFQGMGVGDDLEKLG